MTVAGLTLPPGADVLDASGRGGTGNVIVAYRHADPPRVLKIYRTRRSRLREALGDFAHRFLEGKRGATATARCATERLLIDAWTRAGFEVVRRLDLPPPPGLEHPSNWLALATGPTLRDVLQDAGVPVSRKQDLLRRLGRECARRHQVALETGNRRLLHERGHVAHVFVEGDRLVVFDLENAYRDDYPVARAAARELTGFARSLASLRDAVPAQRALMQGYREGATLDRLLASGLRGPRADLLRRLASL
jgi:hypothetical protein